MKPFEAFESKTVVLPQANIDTDQIIPARFLKGVSRSGLGKWAFADWRYDAQGQPKVDFALNTPQAQGAQVLVAGDNFGCGSSREHAPWALTDLGLRAVVSSRIANIFRQNAVKNGLLPIQVDAEVHRSLLASPGARVRVDLAAQTLTLPDGRSVKFPIDPFARYCLLNGQDELSFLLSHAPAIARFEESRRS
ncbi:MAG: 3-isopropylmalate dehydratase small subunit [Myxococcaceae bacterium]